MARKAARGTRRPKREAQLARYREKLARGDLDGALRIAASQLKDPKLVREVNTALVERSLADGDWYHAYNVAKGMKDPAIVRRVHLAEFEYWMYYRDFIKAMFVAKMKLNDTALIERVRQAME